MNRSRAVAIFWMAMSVAATVLYSFEADRHCEVTAAAGEAEIARRNPVAVEAVRLARDPDHAAASFARAVVVDSLIEGDISPASPPGRLVLMRSFAAYLPPDRFPHGDYGAELLANQELLARAEMEPSALSAHELLRARNRARDLALEGIALRPQFAEHHFTLEMLQATRSSGQW